MGVGSAGGPGAGALPAGTVTFLFTDLEGSTAPAGGAPRRLPGGRRRHHALLRGAVEAHGGAVFETVGDAVYAAFARPADAVAAALAGQRALQGEDWGEVGRAPGPDGAAHGGGGAPGGPLLRGAPRTAAPG